VTSQDPPSTVFWQVLPKECLCHRHNHAAATGLNQNNSVVLRTVGLPCGHSAQGRLPASTGKRTEIMMHPLCQVPGRWQCRASIPQNISIGLTCVLPRPLRSSTATVVPQRDRSTALFGSHRYDNGLGSNREIVGRSRLIQNDSGLPQGPAVAPPASS
jgi:hypothetical protein